MLQRIPFVVPTSLILRNQAAVQGLCRIPAPEETLKIQRAEGEPAPRFIKTTATGGIDSLRTL